MKLIETKPRNEVGAAVGIGCAYMGGMPDVNAHVARVDDGGGEGYDNTFLTAFYRFLLGESLLSDSQLIWTPDAGYVVREDGVLKYIRTGFDLSDNDNDLDGSATASQQPRLVGGLAPGSHPAASNQNDEARYFTHPAISFAATDAWSVSILINRNSRGTTEYIVGNNSNTSTIIGVINISGIIRIYNNIGNDVFDTGAIFNTVGKNTLLTFTAHGNGIINIYTNGLLKSTVNIVSSMTFSSLFKGAASAGLESYSTISAYHIQSGALTATQVADLHTFLRNRYPEIESVTIGSQIWASRNFEAVATPAGNVIANVTANGAVEKITGGNFESGLIGTASYGTGQTGTYTINTTSPISGTQDGRLVITVAGTENGRPSLNFIASRVVSKFRRFSFKYKVNSGTCELRSFFKGASIQSLNITLTGSGTYTSPIFKVDGTSNLILYFTNNVFDLQIDDVSEQELNWSNATEIYDAVYAATSGTAAQKEYAALKEAAAWAYHTNSVDLGATYGKIYNGYGKDLLVDDIATQGSWGYHVATESELTTLATNGGYALKYEGTDFWATTGGTNTTGFTALGGGTRSDVDGSFSTIKETTAIWCADSDKVLLLNHADNTATITAVDKMFGAYIRLVED